MEFGALIILFALFLIVIMVVIRPYFNVPYQSMRSMESVTPPQHAQKKLSVLLTKQEQIIERIEEIENDYHQGKIPDALYDHTRKKILGEGAEILRQVEQLRISMNLIAENGMLYQIDKQDEEKITTLISEHRKKRKEKMIGFCSKCGKPVQKSDQFCSRCGNGLEH